MQIAKLLWGFDILTAVTIPRDVLPCSLVECYRKFGGAYCLHEESMNKPSKKLLLASSSSSFTLKIEAVHSSEMMVDFYQNTWHHIREDSTIYEAPHYSVSSLSLSLSLSSNKQSLCTCPRTEIPSFTTIKSRANLLFCIPLYSGFMYRCIFRLELGWLCQLT
jgi:hypothetical protein